MATAQQEIKSLKAELAQLKQAVEAQVEDVTPNGDGTDGRFDMQNVRARARLAGQKARKFFDEKQGQVKDARDATEKTIKARPFASTAVAFAGGALVAALIARK
jgi:ElaB/YqjD/DUF883 family membrane-anchored ribosome-binding protein